METALILGSGWNAIINQVVILKRESYQKLFHLKSTVPGHSGELIHARLKHQEILIMSGRFHLYEGYSPQQVTRPIQYLKKLGVKNLIITNAVGGLNPKYRVGDFVVLSDIITLLSQTPLVGPKFVDMSQVFNLQLIKLAEKQAKKLRLRCHRGVYAYCHGPQYETPADKRALIAMGADVVGMSNVPETIMANYLGMKVLGLTFVTNLAFVKHSHGEVLAESAKAAPNMSKLLTGIIGKF
ncbi:MAG: purine-nucleoside phosphorylase [Candidatus Beckwithbacteria bacterium]|nr:purine-nucleoside phosphorylase [Candidatus Beckwithbacteria bacterium]